jgi:hypothetical protein
MRKLFFGVAVLGLALGACTTTNNYTSEGGPPPIGDATANYHRQGGMNRSGEYYANLLREGGGEHQRAESQHEQGWSKISSTGKGAHSCSINIHFTLEPNRWLSPEEAHAFGDFLRDRICPPPGKKIPAEQPEWVKNWDKTQEQETGSYKTSDGKIISWAPKS